MKRSFLLFPVASLVLTACSSNESIPIVSAEDSEFGSVAIQQPSFQNNQVEQAGWQSNMPAENYPLTANAPSYTVPEPSYQPAPQPTYKPQKPVKPKAQPAPVAKKTVPQDFSIPRDENNAPIYNQIDKGFYKGDSYTVRKGDTMFLIAYIAGKDVKEIARLNNMHEEPYQLKVGQVLTLNKGVTPTAAPSKPTPKQHIETTEPKPAITYTTAANGTAYGSDGTVVGPIKASVGTVPPTKPTVSAAVEQPTIKVTEKPINQATDKPVVNSSIRWQWPAQGRVIVGFSSVEGGNKGLDIAGNKGDPVKAAADGKVVLVGDIVPGYGNLIMIKHNDQFLSAYAHNDTIKVKEQDKVKAGETIATLGSSGTNSSKLHFEIRYRGKSVDPTLYLPKR